MYTIIKSSSHSEFKIIFRHISWYQNYSHLLNPDKGWFWMIYQKLRNLKDYMVPNSVTRRVKGILDYSESMVERSLSDLIKYMLLIRITSRVDIAKSDCPYERWDNGNYKSSASLFQQVAMPWLAGFGFMGNGIGKPRPRFAIRTSLYEYGMTTVWGVDFHTHKMF